MKKVGCLFVLFLVAVPAVSGQISVRLKGGWTSLSPVDYNDGVQGRFDHIASFAAAPPQGSFGKIHGGWNISGEVAKDITKNFSAGISLGYIRAATDGQVVYQYPTTSPTLLFGGTTKVTTSVSAVPVLVNAHYALPVGKILTLNAGLGAGVYFCSVDYNYNFIGGYMGATDWNETQTFAGHKITFGLEAEVGVEIPVTKKIFVQANFGGRLATISNLQGDYSDVGTSDKGPYNYQSSEGYFTVYDYNVGGKIYHQYAFDDILRTSSPNYRKGDIRLSGISLSGGIRVAL